MSQPPPPLVRCTYGACIAPFSPCNGKLDAIQPHFCRYRRGEDYRAVKISPWYYSMAGDVLRRPDGEICGVLLCVSLY